MRHYINGQAKVSEGLQHILKMMNQKAGNLKRIGRMNHHQGISLSVVKQQGRESNNKERKRDTQTATEREGDQSCQGRQRKGRTNKQTNKLFFFHLYAVCVLLITAAFLLIVENYFQRWLKYIWLFYNVSIKTLHKVSDG